MVAFALMKKVLSPGLLFLLQKRQIFLVFPLVVSEKCKAPVLHEIPAQKYDATSYCEKQTAISKDLCQRLFWAGCFAFLKIAS